MKVITDLEEIKGKTIKEAIKGYDELTKVVIHFTDGTYCMFEAGIYNAGIELIDTEDLDIDILKYLKLITEEEYEKREKAEQDAIKIQTEIKERDMLAGLKAKYEKEI
ncbi:MAG: hypothetical protein GY834_10610 [Bacteroidetes bacterium]|nr:hypothetical protein [Bacteroidota bacterium]